MATSNAAQGLGAWKAIGLTDSGSGDAVITGAPEGLTASGIEIAAAGVMLVGVESPAGTYTFTRATASCPVLYFLL